jgi:glycosyltransferase involved in cell wall biosynthesis
MIADQKYPHSLSIVMPVFNEQDVIAKVVVDYAGILDRFEKPEIVIVNDCSTDGTLSTLNSLQKDYPYIKVITPPENRGHGPSLATAYRKSTGDFVFHCDSDNQFVADEFWLFWRKLTEENLDVVIGFRGTRHDPLARLLLTRLVRAFLWFSFQVNPPDSNCPFRLLTRAAIDRILPLLPERPLVPSILITVAAYKLRMKIDWINVTHLPRLTGKMFLRSWKIFKLCSTAVREVIVFKRRLSMLKQEAHVKRSEQHVNT